MTPIEKEKTDIERVQESIDRLEDFQKINTLNDDEVVEVKRGRTPDAASRVTYQGPEGSFTIKVDPKKGTATASGEFMTGNFKSTIADGVISTKGTWPVYHQVCGIFHDSFNPKKDI